MNGSDAMLDCKARVMVRPCTDIASFGFPPRHPATERALKQFNALYIKTRVVILDVPELRVRRHDNPVPIPMVKLRRGHVSSVTVPPHTDLGFEH
jgi:hypothetical protein